MSNEQNMEVFDWDSEISADGQDFSPLPEGDYVFEVTDLKKEYFSGSAKLPACPRAAMTLKVYSEDMSRSVTVYEGLLLCAKMEWRVSGFLRCVGMKKHGQKVRPNWDHMIGASGVAHFKVEDYTGKDGTTRQRNHLDTYIDKDGTAPVAPVKSASDFSSIPNGAEEEIPFV